MGIQVTAAGMPASLGIMQGPPHDSKVLRRTQEGAEERKATIARFASSLPGNRGSSRGADLHTASSDLEQVSLAFNRRLKFMVDHESHNVTVKVIDVETDKVIKELPPEELKRMHNKIKETIGFLFDEKV